MMKYCFCLGSAVMAVFSLVLFKLDTPEMAIFGILASLVFSSWSLFLLIDERTESLKKEWCVEFEEKPERRKEFGIPVKDGDKAV